MHGKAHTGDGVKKVRREKVSRAIPAPEANAELQPNLDVSETNYVFFVVQLLSQ